MPTNRRHRPQPRRVEAAALDFDHEYELLHGRGFIECYPDLDSMRRTWELHRDTLMTAWIAERPGTRPFAWWLFEGVPEHGERPIVDKQWESLYVRDGWTIHGILHTTTLPPVQEPERDWLDRHGFLSDDERTALAAR